MLVAAEHPVLYADRAARTPVGLQLLIELAEVLQAGVCDSQNRFNFPWRHPLNQTHRQQAALREADVVLMLEAGNPFALVSRAGDGGTLRRALKESAKAISISSVGLAPKGNYQLVQRYAADLDLELAADAEATLPFLIEEVKRQMPASRKAAIEARGKSLGEAHLEEIARSKARAAYAWDGRPITMPRLCQELYNQIRNEDWSLVSSSAFQSYWPQQLWHADKHYQYIGAQGGVWDRLHGPRGSRSSSRQPAVRPPQRQYRRRRRPDVRAGHPVDGGA